MPFHFLACSGLRRVSRPCKGGETEHRQFTISMQSTLKIPLQHIEKGRPNERAINKLKHYNVVSLNSELAQFDV